MSTHHGLQPQERADTTGSDAKIYVSKDLPIELIDEPSLAERETMEPEALAELAMSILTIGLTNPITVIERSGRYEVIAGHRRLLACRLAELPVVPCRIRVGGDVDPLAILISENDDREKVNPVQQARFYQRLLVERCGNDVDRLCELVKRRREMVEGRLLLLMGHPAVVAAVETGKIKLGVANELNKIPDPGRLQLLLDVAINSGATARQIAQWAREGAQLGDVYVEAATSAEATPAPPSTYTSNPMQCVLCEGDDFPHMMEMLWVHGPCKKILMRMLQRDAGAAPGSEG